MRWTLLVVGLVVVAATAWFVQSLFVTPWLRTPPSVSKLKEELKGIQRPAEIMTANQGVRQPNWLRYKRAIEKQVKLAGRARTPAEKKTSVVQPGTDIPEVRLAYFGSWDQASIRSLSTHGNQLTHVAVERYAIRWQGAELKVVEQADSALDALAANRGIIVMPMLTNAGEGNVRIPEPIEWLALMAPDARAEFVRGIVEKVTATKAGGLILDFQQVDPTHSDALTAFYSELAAALRKEGREFWMSVPMGEDLVSYQLDRLAAFTDRFLAVLHGENSDADPAGPTASREWFEGWLETALGYGEPAQWIAVLGTGGFDWTAGEAKGRYISFVDAMARGDYAGLDELQKAGLRVSGPTFEPNFTYLDQKGRKHTVWFQDAITFSNQVATVRRRGVGGIGIDRIGGEDPGIWVALKSPAPLAPAALKSLATIVPGEEVATVGEGCVVQVNTEVENGSRVVDLGADGRVTCRYNSFPAYHTLFCEGRPKGDKLVNLSFDDGPDPTWTPLILDLLKREGVKATFYIVGSRAELYPGLVRRIVDEGHELGSHTYTHSNIFAATVQQVRLELNATQRLIETITGRSTLLLRPPYQADSRPTRADDIRTLNLVQSMGYMVALEDIDSQDWARDSVDQIVERVKLGRAMGGNVVLLHDAGGNREMTLQALPRIIDYLQKRGDRIALVHELLGKTYSATMPALDGGKQTIARLVASVGFRVFHWIESFTWTFLLVATVLILARTVLVIGLASAFRWRREPDPTFRPAVSVVIAAYNEAKVIAATIRSVLATDYEGDLELLVINDGSTDGTGAIVADLAARDPRIRLIDQPNGGKASALQRGFREARHDFAVLLDADTQFRPDTIGQLIQPLRDERVGAVSGHAKVGNPSSLIARCQALEYICGFNLDRRAYARWNCITVAPGAISALRLEAVREVGGISHDTLAEDTDLTLALHRSGWRIDYMPTALAYTEAPETFAGLAKQRFRWAFGTMQSLWKHRDMTLNPRFGALGLFSLPSIWFFQIFLVALTPLVDLGLVVSLLLGNGAAILPYVLAYLAVDCALAVVACLLEREPIWRAWVILPMRLIYRVLLSYVVWKSIARAFQGVLVGWGKLERTAGVDLSERDAAARS
ncbi:MAG: glycosyltransferase [Verrucomicrobia bacterium]|nr:glycosyltransferase [Verrucomicrobiota bacterium]